MIQDVASELATTVAELDEDWRSNGEDLELPYVALGHLARRIVELDDAVQPNWEPFFAEFETRLAAADPATRELLIVGFIEGIQNIAENTGRNPARWKPLLGPLTDEAWEAVNDMWMRRISPKQWNDFVSRDIHRR
jgi:hypothetical protein